MVAVAVIIVVVVKYDSFISSFISLSSFLIASFSFI